MTGPKKVVIAVGGTGGHLFPAQAFARQLLQGQGSGVEVVFVGGGLSENRLFDRTQFAWHDVACPAHWNRGAVAAARATFRLLRGVGTSYGLFGRLRPDLIVGFGSHYSLPALAAAWIRRIPFVLHEQNSIPGKVNRLFSSRALFTGTYFPEARMLLKGKSLVVDMPLREGYGEQSLTREAARRAYGLHPDSLTFLIFGGSQGAQRINELIVSAARLLVERSIQFQVLHFTGDAASSAKVQGVYRSLGITAVVKSFEAEMARAWRAADLAISRAGALSIAEQIEMEVPGLLLPWSGAAENHQEQNARFVVETVGGGRLLLESSITAESLAQVIANVCSDEQKMLLKMREAIKDHKAKLHRESFYGLICDALNIQR